MSSAELHALLRGTEIRVQGIVQGVGFRPLVWRLAHEFDVRGSVRNDGSGVLIRIWAAERELQQFVQALREQAPPLSRIDDINCTELAGAFEPADFTIASSNVGDVHTAVAPDAATCAACFEDSRDPFSRRYRYPFTNCTHCGPRLTIINQVPYDRAHTSMARFKMCAECEGEYADPANRRFHAQPNACHACGPRAWLQRLDGRAMFTETLSQLDDVDAACSILQQGHILAIKSLGGFHLACDATRAESVEKLRAAKQRFHKPFALMARDTAIIRRYCALSACEDALLNSTQAPIVILRTQGNRLPDAIAPGQNTLGFMLPYTPLHRLLLERMQGPIVLTSGNAADEPPCIDNADAITRLGQIAEYLLLHDRDIVNRVDDSVLRVVAGVPRMIRRARGYAPAPIPLPDGFKHCPPLLAMGGELKNTFCVVKDGSAIVSQHIGDLKDAATHDDYLHNLRLYAGLYRHEPQAIVVDSHDEYLSSKRGDALAQAHGLALHRVSHHHAHVAACLADNQWPIDAGQVLGVALDGLGLGSDGTLCGGEFLLADYRSAQRVGTFKPVALIGGDQAMREPWRNTYAHLMAEIGWPALHMNFKDLELVRFFESQPRETFDRMLSTGFNAPHATSAGRLFDAVAAAMGVCRDRVSYEGQAAIELEALVDPDALINEDDSLAYPFSIPRLRESNLPYIEPLAMWQALLGDLLLQTSVPVMAARFHKGLARVLFHMIRKLSTGNEQRVVNTVALSGGVFHNGTLLELLLQRLQDDGFEVLTHRQVPANDGGLALGQAVIGAAHEIDRARN